MGILSQFASGMGDLFKLMILTIMAVTIALMVMSMANSYESTAKIGLGIESDSAWMEVDTETSWTTAP